MLANLTDENVFFASLWQIPTDPYNANLCNQTSYVKKCKLQLDNRHFTHKLSATFIYVIFLTNFLKIT